MSRTLSPAERARLDELFDRASELPRDEHTAFLARECGPNDPLRVELARLLVGLAAEDRLAHVTLAAPLPRGTRIGPYELVELIGEGGMGEVYAADQRAPVARRVALKVVKPGMDSAQVLARFEAERQALARMAHPYIAQVLDAGTTEAGRPYFVMEHVAGESITAYCDRHRLTTRARIELFVRVCEGVQHAHQKGIVHRDLKPSNVLVTQQDGIAWPKIIDFGVARALTGRLAERSWHTMLGQIIGTLDYMSPEQADPTSADVDTRSDIYSLGVLLYELVSGLLPFDRYQDTGLSLSEVQRAIREKEAPTPSARLRRQTGTATTVAPLHGTSERALIRQLHGDLDWICLKALEKDPERRYASASELAADLRRHLAFEPVQAGRPRALYRLGRFVRKRRVEVGAGVLAAAAVLAGIIGVVSGRLVARAQEPYLDILALAQLEARADTLWPAHPDRIPALERWLVQAEALEQDLARHRASLAALRRRALPPLSEEEERAAFPRAERLAMKEAELEASVAERAKVEADPEVGRGGPWTQDERERFDAAIAACRSEVAALRAARAAHSTWRFASDTDRSRHDTLMRLVAGLARLRDDPGGLLTAEGASSEHGWSVPRRLALARRLRDGLAEGGEWDERWTEARTAVRQHPAYGGLTLTRQVGLVPIGQAPNQPGQPGRPGQPGLFEFWHVASGVEPMRDERGELMLTAETGIVLVLIPGGTFWMGAQSSDEQGRNFDPSSRPGQRESPPHEVPVEPFFLSKYELTQSQWEHTWGMNPSLVQWGMKLFHAPLNPVNQMNWNSAMATMRQLGLALPTEEQWEYAARAGTDTIWWTGDDVESLRGNAGLHFGPRSAAAMDELAVIDHVQSYAANPWGLYNVHGNVWEWCLNRPYEYGTLPDSDWSTLLLRACRGGSKRTPPQMARSAARRPAPVEGRAPDVGLRPARSIDP